MHTHIYFYFDSDRYGHCVICSVFSLVSLFKMQRAFFPATAYRSIFRTLLLLLFFLYHDFQLLLRGFVESYQGQLSEFYAYLNIKTINCDTSHLFSIQCTGIFSKEKLLSVKLSVISSIISFVPVLFRKTKVRPATVHCDKHQHCCSWMCLDSLSLNKLGMLSIEAQHGKLPPLFLKISV